MDELDRADVEPAGGLADEQHVRIAVELARDDDLLLVAAGEGVRAQQRIRRAHVELVHLPPGGGDDVPPVHEDGAVVGAVVVVAQDRGLVGREGRDQTHALPVLRHVAQAGVAHAARVGRVTGVAHHAAADRHRAGVRPLDPGQQRHQLRLAVAGHAGDADDLAPAHAQAHVPHAAHAGGVGVVQVVGGKHRLAGRGGALLHAQQHRAAHHELGQVLLRGLRGIDVGHDLAGAHHRHAVGGGHDLAQLVGDQDHGPALFPERGQDPEQLVGLLRRQHPGRFVQDQGLGAAVQRLEDLHPLLDADRQVADRGIDVHLQPVLPRQVGQRVARAAQAALQKRGALGAQQDVLQHRQGLHQHEVLVDHADAGGDRVARAGDRRRPAGYLDRAGVGAVEPVEDAHQGRLAGAVLADDAVNGPGRHHQRHVAVGLHGAEPLVDPPQRDSGGRPLRQGQELVAM